MENHISQLYGASATYEYGVTAPAASTPITSGIRAGSPPGRSSGPSCSAGT